MQAPRVRRFASAYTAALSFALLVATTAPALPSAAEEVYAPKPEALRSLCRVITETELVTTRFGRMSEPTKVLIESSGVPIGVVESGEGDIEGKEYLKRHKLVKFDKLTESENQQIRKGWFSLLEMPGNVLTCENDAFGSQKSVLKYAVAMRFYPFIKDALRWRLYLNAVDRSDCGTVLDYVYNENAKFAGTDDERDLRTTIRLIRDAGGKRARELEPGSVIVSGGGVLPQHCTKQMFGK